MFSSLTYFFSRSGSHMSDFQLALQKYVKRDAAGKELLKASGCHVMVVIIELFYLCVFNLLSLG